MPEQCVGHMRSHCVSHMHVRTYGRTYEELLTLSIHSHLSNAQEASRYA